jgi:hypothetical protein
MLAMNPNLSPVIARAVKAERAELERKRAALTAPIDKEIAELDAFLAGGFEAVAEAPPPPAPASPGSSDRQKTAKAVNKEALDYCFEILSPYDGPPIFAATKALHEAVVKNGIRLQAADPLGRLTSLLSQDPRFTNVRGQGWSIKPASAPASPPEAASNAPNNGEAVAQHDGLQ